MIVDSRKVSVDHYASDNTRPIRPSVDGLYRDGTG